MLEVVAMMPVPQVPALVAILSLFWTTVSSVCQERQAKSVETDAYVITVPSGGNWNIKADKKSGVIRLQRRNPVTIIEVSPRPVEESRWQWAEQQIARDYCDGEVAMMMVQGALQNLYVPQDVTQDTMTLDARKLYTLSYRTVGEHFGKPNGQAILYVYFPPDFKEKHIFYRFLMHQVTSERDAPNPVDFAPVREVIASFRLR